MNLNVKMEKGNYVQSFYCYNSIHRVLCKLMGERCGFSRYTVYRHFFCCVAAIISVSLLAQRTM